MERPFDFLFGSSFQIKLRYIVQHIKSFDKKSFKSVITYLPQSEAPNITVFNYQSEGESLLNACIRHDKLEFVKLLFERFRFVTNDYLSFKAELSPLFKAANCNRLTIMNFLVDKGFIVKDHEDSFHSMIIVPLIKGYRKMVEFLLDKGAQIDLKGKIEGKTPLIYMCEHNNHEQVEFLITRGANVNLCDQFKTTPLMYACKHGSLKTVQLLVEKEAKINHFNMEGDTALHYCVLSNNFDSFTYLIEKGAVFCKNQYGDSPLSLAAMHGHGHFYKYTIQARMHFQLYNGEPMHAFLDKFDALELMGVHHVIKRYDHQLPNLKMTFDYWQKAMMIRLKKMFKLRLQGYSSQLATYFEKKVIKPKSVYGNNREIDSLNQMMLLNNDPKQLEYQSLMMLERILGLCNPFFYQILHKVGSYYMYDRNISEAIKYFMYGIKAHCANMHPINANQDKFFLAMVKCMHCVETNITEQEYFHYSTVSCAMALIQLKKSFGQIIPVVFPKTTRAQQRMVHNLMKCCVELIRPFFIDRYEHERNDAGILNDLIKDMANIMFVTDYKCFAMHYACDIEYRPRPFFEYDYKMDLNLICTLVRASAPKNVFNNQEQTPLHVLCRSQNKSKYFIIAGLLRMGVMHNLWDHRYMKPMHYLEDHIERFNIPGSSLEDRERDMAIPLAQRYTT